MESATHIYSRIIYPEVAAEINFDLTSLQKAMLDASPDCVKILAPNGNLVTMNKAGCLALHVDEDSGFGMPWLSLLPLDIHPQGIAALREVTEGRPARFIGKSISPNGLVYWDNLLTPMTDANGVVVSILCVSRDVTEKHLLALQLEQALEREQLLSREMQHRVKNLLSVVTGLMMIAEKEAAADKSNAAMDILREKVDSLARAFSTTFSSSDPANLKAHPPKLGTIVQSVLEPFGERCAASGNEVVIRHDSVSTFSLLLHELATNSVKYGALSWDTGQVSINWSSAAKNLELSWTEIGGPALSSTPPRQGFGTQMIERIVRSSGGTISRLWHAEGLEFRLSMPHSVFS